ncbi:hypothetical protein VPH35_111087 [Triticum aestivum]
MAPTSRISHCPHVVGAPLPPPKAVHRSRTLDPAATMSLSCCSMAQLLHLVEGGAFPMWNASVHEVGAEKEDGIYWLRWRSGSRFPPLKPLRPTAALGGGVRRVHQSNPMASGCPSFVAAISSDTCVTACVAITTICVTTCSVTGLLRTVTPAALLPLPEAARALPSLISYYGDELLYIAEVPYPLNGTSMRMQQLG